MFAVARQLVGDELAEVEVTEPATVCTLRRALVKKYPTLDGMIDRMMIAVDSEYAEDGTPVTSRSKVACIPPVSGG